MIIQVYLPFRKKKVCYMKKIHWQKSMAVTLALIILMAAASVIVVRNINTYEGRKML